MWSVNISKYINNFLSTNSATLTLNSPVGEFDEESKFEKYIYIYFIYIVLLYIFIIIIIII